MASLSFLGAAQGVTGSRFLVAGRRSQGLVDCGLFQGSPEVAQRNWAAPPFDPAALDWVVLTHAHLDHAGYLPRLVRLGFAGPVYATPATLDLARLLLIDTGCIQEEDAAAGEQGTVTAPLYTAADARACLSQFRPIQYDELVGIAPGIRLRLREAGHILGSSVVELWVEVRPGEQRKLVFSGDLGRPVAGLLRPPARIETADIVVLESTYGGRAHTAERPEEVLARAVDEAVAGNGRLLVPAFAVGRAQDVLFLLRALQAEGRVPPLPIYLDSPLAREATELFAAYPSYHGPAVRAWLASAGPRRPVGQVTFVTSSRETEELAARQEPMVIIAGSGMATGGRVLTYLKAWLPEPRTVVLFPGYQAAGTLGRALVDGASTVEIAGEVVPVRARIRQSDAFSAHADAPAILDWLAGFRSPPGQVFLVHGEPSALGALARRITATLGWPARAPSLGERVSLAQSER